MPAEEVPWFDKQQSVQIKVTTDIATALGLPVGTSDVTVESVTTQGGFLLVTVRDTPTQITRYLLPPQAIRWARQQLTVPLPGGTPPSG